MSTILVIAPHPDDETLGCGGTLLRAVAEGHSVHWLTMTAMQPSLGFTPERIASRNEELASVSKAYGFTQAHHADFPTTRLDTVPMGDLIGAVGRVIRDVQPNTVYMPYRNDAHSDHAAVFDAAAACCKSFRHPSIKRACVYETLSETEFGLRTDDPGFRANVFVDISPWLERKLEIMKLYAGELGTFPFPRSEPCIRAQAVLRGSQAGAHAAEAFMLLKEIQ